VAARPGRGARAAAAHVRHPRRVLTVPPAADRCGWVFLQEPDFYPTGTVEPEDQRRFWQGFLRWAEQHQIDYFVRRIAPWLQEEGLEQVAAEGHTTLYNGGSPYARWWQLGIAEVADQMLDQGATESATLDEFFRLYDDPNYWTMTIAFTVVTGRRSQA
jgi:hypothetical protein